MAAKESSGRSRSSSTTRGKGSRRAGSTTPRSTAAGRSDKSVQAFRDALEHSVTISRDRLQEVVDDAVERGRITRTDANELVSRVVTRSRQYTDDLLRDLERLLEQARKELETRVAPARRSVTKAAGRASRAARDASDRPLAQADRLRRRAPVRAGFPITAYDQLTAVQVKSRLTDLAQSDLRKVRDRERRGKARKGILEAIERELNRS